MALTFIVIATFFRFTPNQIKIKAIEAPEVSNEGNNDISNKTSGTAGSANTNAYNDDGDTSDDGHLTYNEAITQVSWIG